MRSKTTSFVTRVFCVAALTTISIVGVASADQTVILVRHAEKVKGGIDDPELTDAGKKRALALVDVVKGARLTHIITTQFKRTKATAEPTAAANDVSITVVATEGDIDSHCRDVATAVTELPADAVVLVVGHSNTIPRIVTALGGPALSDMSENDNATVFVVVRAKGKDTRVVRSTYGAPPIP